MRVLVLAKSHVGAGHPDVGHQMQFVAVELGIATRRACDASGAALARGLSGSSFGVLVFCVDMVESSFAG